MKGPITLVAASAATVLLTGCSGWQSTLDTHSPQADEIRQLIIIFAAIAAVIWIAVMVALAVGLLRRKESRADPLVVDTARERTAGRVIFGCAVLTFVIVFGLSLLSYVAQRTVFAKDANALRVSVIGHQWWWEVRYDTADPQTQFTTANEIRVPVGRPVNTTLKTRDVIHSFWVPSLMGKMDLINGQQNDIQFTADHAGVYRGQCAEFCGLQHAHMALEVIALAPQSYSEWRDNQIRPARIAADPQARQGETLFRSKGCALCHTVRGTLAGGRLGPDLTHIASRNTIAAGTLPNNSGSLAAWISNPQHIKPGTQMPTVRLLPQELIAIVHYLGGLQ